MEHKQAKYLRKMIRRMYNTMRTMEEILKREYTESQRTAAAASALPTNSPESLLSLADDELPQDTGLIPVVVIMDESAPPQPITPLGQGSTFKDMDRLLAEIAEGKLRRLDRESRERTERATFSTMTGLTSYAKPIMKPKNSESNT